MMFLRRIVVLSSLLIGCFAAASDKSMTVCEFEKSAQYDGKKITMTGRLLIAYERREITSPSCKYKIWANLSDSTYAKVRDKWNQPIDVEVAGTLHTKRKSYGHMGAWPAEIDVEALKMLNPAPSGKL